LRRFRFKWRLVTNFIKLYNYIKNSFVILGSGGALGSGLGVATGAAGAAGAGAGGAVGAGVGAGAGLANALGGGVAVGI
jgi:hypothetical protein